MKILVTGSNGCVGSALMSLFDSAKNWIFIDRNDCDLTDRKCTVCLFKNIGADYIVHLASYVPGFYDIDKVSSVATNVRINENVLEASHLSGIDRGMFCLSVNMFAKTPSKFPMDEAMMFDDGLYGAFAGYAYSKRMLALQCNNYNEQYGRRYFGIIPSNIFGPNDNLSAGRLVSSLILRFKRAIKNDSDVILNGTGRPLRQFIYSYDLANIIGYLVFNYADTNHIICCSDTEITIHDLAIKIGNILSFNKQIRFNGKQDGCHRKTMSNTMLKRIMPGISFTPLENGLRDTARSMGSIL